MEIGDFLDRTDWVLATECIPDGRDLYGVLKNKSPESLRVIEGSKKLLRNVQMKLDFAGNFEFVIIR